MKVELEVTFTKDEVLAMCLKQCERIETAVEGRFEARMGPYYSGEVVCTFKPKSDDGAEVGPDVFPVPVSEEFSL